MKTLKSLLVVALAATAFAGGYALRGGPPQGSAAAGGRTILYWVDPMHPAYKSDKPGIAPDCGMALEPVYADATGAKSEGAPSRPRRVLYYRDPALPSYRSDKPGLSPETGNDLEPVYADDPATMPAGTVRITPERQQLIGVKFAEVRAASADREIRTVGQVAADETRVSHVHTRVDGWVERVFADFTGDLVRKGQPLLTIYSPEMLASQQELLLAARARDLMRQNPLDSAQQQGESLFEASRRRLQLWDLSDAQIDRVLKTGTPIRSVTLYAPASGYVTERNVFPNQKVTPESDLYTIVDLSRVWVLADVFESDAVSARVGASAEVRQPYSTRPPLRARITYVQPQVDPTTRALKVRLEMPNPGLQLKPNMYVDVSLSVSQAPRLTVPADAVLDSGGRQTVFVDRGQGYLEPRAVTVGDRAEGRVAILSGLAEGERVVASGTFLVDSESQLRAVTSGMRPAGHTGAPPAAGATISEPAKPQASGARDARPAPPRESRHD